MGALAGITLQYAFPIILYYRFFKDKVSKKIHILNFTLLFFSIFFGCLSVENGIKKLI